MMGKVGSLKLVFPLIIVFLVKATTLSHDIVRKLYSNILKHLILMIPCNSRIQTLTVPPYRTADIKEVFCILQVYSLVTKMTEHSVII